MTGGSTPSGSAARISVVIPVYDRERYVGDAVRSVLEQTRPADELVVVDDGSTDRSMAVVRAFDSPMLRIVERRNGGIGAARNSGVAVATGDLIAFLDSDDVWLPEKLALQERALGATGAMLAFGHLVEFLSPDREQELAGAFEVGLRPAPGLCATTLLARREALDRVGPFDEAFRVGEFIDWLGRASDLDLDQVVVPEVVARRRIHGGNSVLTRSNADYLRVLKRAIDRRREKAAHGG
jgi:glycosyltransferase involved in cell wall biosynthesis